MKAHSMVVKPDPKVSSSNDAEAEAKLQAAHARVKSVTDKHAAVVDVLSRVGVTAINKRLAQVEVKKLDRELREARRLLAELQASARKQP